MSRKECPLWDIEETWLCWDFDCGLVSKKCEAMSFSCFQAPPPQFVALMKATPRNQFIRASLLVMAILVSTKHQGGMWSQNPRRSFVGHRNCVFIYWDNPKTQRKKHWQKEPGRQQGLWVGILASSSLRQAKVYGVSFWSLQAMQTGTG